MEVRLGSTRVSPNKGCLASWRPNIAGSGLQFQFRFSPVGKTMLGATRQHRFFLDLEVSFGTHFFLDLMEARTYPLALYLDDRQMHFNRSFFYQTPTRLHDWLPGGEALTGCMLLIKVDDSPSGPSRCLVMEDNADKAVAFIRKID
jgi:hypothetical protein